MTSETSKCRSVLAPYCNGVGIDIGAGGDPINSTALCIDHPNHELRAHTGQTPTHLSWDASKLPFESESLDYVYSSHCLEDAIDTVGWLREWLRVIKPGGKLVLFLPDQAAYVAHCESNGTLPNQAHKHANFSLKYVLGCLKLCGVREVDTIQPQGPFPGSSYSFALVIIKPSTTQNLLQTVETPTVSKRDEGVQPMY